jgi:RND superfamily putative drug exporter
MGRWNWWAPKPLVWLHERFGISEEGGLEAAEGTVAAAPGPEATDTAQKATVHNGREVPASVTRHG